MVRRGFMAWLGCLLISLPLQAQDHTTGPWHFSGAHQRLQTIHMLHGLVPRLDAAVAPETLAIYPRQEPTGPGQLRVGIRPHGTFRGQIHVGLFRDPEWWKAPPVHVRTVSGPGIHVLTDLEPGQYYVGVMCGMLPHPSGVGVHQSWPDSVTVDATQQNQVLVNLHRGTDWLSDADLGLTHIEAMNYRFERKRISGEHPRVFCVQVVDSSGQPVPYCRVEYTEQPTKAAPPGASLREAGLTGSDGRAYFELHSADSSIRLQCTRRDFVVDPPISRSITRIEPQPVFPANNSLITLQAADLPVGDHVVTGRLTDTDGRPVQAAWLTLQTTEPTARWAFSVTNAEGRFAFPNIPRQASRLQVVPHDLTNLLSAVSQIERNAAQDLHITLERRLTYWGRVQYASGEPPVNGTWIARITDPDAPFADERRILYGHIDDTGLFSVATSQADRDLLQANTGGMLEILDRNNQRLIHTVLLEDLSQDSSEPTPLTSPLQQ